MKKIVLIMAIALLAAVVLLTGCGSSNKPADSQVNAPNQGAQSSQPAAGNSGEKTGAGNSAGNTAAAPDGYPQDIVPLYNLDTVKLFQKLSDQDEASGGGYRLSYISKAPVADVLKFYTDCFAKAGKPRHISNNGVQGDMTGQLKGMLCYVGIEPVPTSLGTGTSVYIQIQKKIPAQ